MLHHMATMLVCYGCHFESKMADKIQKSSDLAKFGFQVDYDVAIRYPLFGSHVRILQIISCQMAAIANQHGRHMVQHVLLSVNIHFH
jgi:hypothetical protein